MKIKLLVFIALLAVSLPGYSQVLETKQFDLKGEKITIVWYSYKCYVAKGEGTQVKFYDGGGNLEMTACRTGGGGEPAYYTFPDGTIRPALF